MVHGCEAVLMGACCVVCVEMCPWCGVGFGMDVSLFCLTGWCVPVLCECMIVVCSTFKYFHG